MASMQHPLRESADRISVYELSHSVRSMKCKDKIKYLHCQTYFGAAMRADKTTSINDRMDTNGGSFK